MAASIDLNQTGVIPTPFQNSQQADQQRQLIAQQRQENAKEPSAMQFFLLNVLAGIIGGLIVFLIFKIVT